MDAIRIGSDEHKALFCKVFVATHDPYVPARIAWPDLDAESLSRLRGLPVWNEAVRTESATAVKVQTLGEVESDPVLGEAIRLQGFEEARHAEVLTLLTRRYGIDVAPFPPPERPKNPTWAFVRTGYGECLDSFFAFGLFAIGRRSGLFPSALVDVFEPVMQEEARHILFLVNWAAYLRARRPLLSKPFFDVRRAWNIAAQAVDRAKGAMQMGGAGKGDGKGEAPTQDGFTMKSHGAFGGISLRGFLELCLSENERRLAPYDARLLRPAIVPPLVKLALKVMPKDKGSEPAAAAAR